MTRFMAHLCGLLALTSSLSAAPLKWIQSNGALVGLRGDGSVASWLLPEKGSEDLVAKPKKGDPDIPLLGLSFVVKQGTSAAWKEEATTQVFGEAGAPVCMTSFSKEGSALSREVLSFFSPDAPVLLNKITFKNSGETPVEAVSLVLCGRLDLGKGSKVSADLAGASLTHEGGNGAFSVQSSKPPAQALLAKDSQELYNQLAAWEKGSPPPAATEASGSRSCFAMAWDIGAVKKGEDQSVVVALYMGGAGDQAKSVLATAMGANVDELLTKVKDSAAQLGLQPAALQSYRVLKAMSLPSGAILSAYPPLLGCRTWDAALACIALSSLGRHDEAKAWLNLAAGLPKGLGGWWNAYDAKGKAPFLPLASVDATGLMLYAFLVEGRTDKAVLENSWDRLKEAADFLAWWNSPDGVPAPTTERETGGIETGTWSLAYAYTGLASAAEIAKILGKEDAGRFESRALKMKEALDKDLTAEGAYVSTFAGLGGLSAKALEGWGADESALGVLENLQELPKGKSGKASPAALASLVWPAGLVAVDKVTLQQENMTALDKALAAVAQKSASQPAALDVDPEAGEGTLSMQDDRLAALPSLSVASALCLLNSTSMPLPPALSGSGQAAGTDQDFVARLKAEAKALNVDMETDAKKVELSLSLGDLLGDLPESLTLASAPTFAASGGIPKEADAVLALSVSSDNTKLNALGDWLAARAGLKMPDNQSEIMGIKTMIMLLMSNCDPEIDVGLLNLSNPDQIAVLAALKLKADKAASFSQAFPLAVTGILTNNTKMKVEQEQSAIGTTVKLADIGVSLVTTPQYLLIAFGPGDPAARGSAAIADPAQSFKSKLPTIEGLGPLALVLDLEKVAAAGAALEGFKETFPGWGKVGHAVVTVVPSTGGDPTLKFRLMLK